MKHRNFVVYYNYVLPEHPAPPVSSTLAPWLMSSAREGYGMIAITTQGENSAPYLNMVKTTAEIAKRLELKDEKHKDALVIITGINELSQSDYEDFLRNG